MLSLRMTSKMPFILVLTGCLIIACQPSAMPLSTPEAQAEAEPTASPTAERPTVTPLPTNTTTLPPATPQPSDTAVPPTPEPTATAAPTPTLTPTTPPSPTPDVGTANPYDIRPLEEVSDGKLPQIVDITDSDAVLVFESTSPLACSVVYGKTTAYGQISVDQDMAGGAHTDHHPLLSGLEPDTEYHYRVQGAAANGTLYVGEDAMFRTLPVQEETEVNLASLEAGARVAEVSSNSGGAANDGPWGANSAIDGNRATAWSSAGDGDDAFIVIELPGTSELHAIEIWTRTMSDGTAQTSAFTLTTDDGKGLGPFTLPDAAQPYRFEVEVTARSLRLDVVESSGGNTGLVEFAAYGRSTAE